ncbi:MAG TPA: fluoride efflux transporter CrcB [Thermoanaerobaculia bacterium]|nr:fluoride efflux transporter CrcB [Thermoanaerobaculia bacterium]
MTRLLLVCAGGAIGSGARYLLTIAMARLAGTAFPWGTLAANLAGCFLISFILESRTSLSPDLRLALTTGVLGGFTTYSAFNYDTTAYLRHGAWMVASANLLLTVMGCFAAGLLGIAAARSFSAL